MWTITQKLSSHGTSGSSTWCQGLTSSSAAWHKISEAFFCAAKRCVCSTVIKAFLQGEVLGQWEAHLPFMFAVVLLKSRLYAGEIRLKSLKHLWIFFPFYLTLFCQCQRFTASWYRVLVKVTWKRKREMNGTVCVVDKVLWPLWTWFCSTHHSVKRNYRLWHDKVEEVINVFSEKEPFGVDVGSHLQTRVKRTRLEWITMWWWGIRLKQSAEANFKILQNTHSAMTICQVWWREFTQQITQCM